MDYFTVFKYNDSLYQIKDALGVLSTLVIGNDKALLFDTGYGIGNLKEEVEKITDKPLIVVNSHGHMDHACGNYLFEKVYIHPEDIELCTEHNGVERRKRNLESVKKINKLPPNFDEEAYLLQPVGNLVPLYEGDYFDLGNIKLEVIMMRGHTKGSIALYNKEEKYLLVGDATCPFVWLFLKESLPVHVYIESLKDALKLDFDNFLVGHGARMFPRSKMEDFLNIALDIKLEDSVQVHFDGYGVDRIYCYTKGRMYDQDDCGVVYDPLKL